MWTFVDLCLSHFHKILIYRSVISQSLILRHPSHLMLKNLTTGCLFPGVMHLVTRYEEKDFGTNTSFWTVLTLPSPAHQHRQTWHSIISSSARNTIFKSAQLTTLVKDHGLWSHISQQGRFVRFFFFFIIFPFANFAASFFLSFLRLSVTLRYVCSINT